MNPQAFSKDSQNPYRTGVLVGNHTEDRFGIDLSQKKFSWQTPNSEVKDRVGLGNSLAVYDFPERSPQELLEDKYMKETENRLNPKRGQAGHLFFGHGAAQDAFEKRDFGTSNDLFFDKKMKTESLINPHYYHGEPKKIEALVTNARIEDTKPIFSGNRKTELKSKAYNESTKVFDQNFNAIGLRK